MSSSNVHATPFDQPPQWAREAVWYQIFVERFRNGNPANNPTMMTCYNALIDPLPDDWAITPWGHNWYEQEPWAKSTGLDFYRTIQMRRYGGDLAGVEEKIPYLVDLGITAIYFNPLNDAPSLHKYDARYYHHIDVTFGDDPVGDMNIITSEDPANPSTWQWTSADKRFLSLVQKLHDHGIKVIMDYSWNHTGNNFWAFMDVKAHPETSRYKQWYYIYLKPDADGKIVFQYKGWMASPNLPELRKVHTKRKIDGHPYEGNMYPEVKKHIFDVCRRWMDPYGNGRTDLGIDGMRLDVAEHIPTGFWTDFRKYVRSVNPDFYLVGENWWEEWPDKLMDPKPWVAGDIFDAVMHYHWYKIARGYFAEPIDRVTLKDFKDKMTALFQSYPDYTQQAMMNLASSHDSPRLLSAFFNVNKYKFHCKPQEDRHYRTDQPGAFTYHRVKLFLLHQFTFVGAPHIWNGDEMGMLGADDPDNRKPLVWPDIEFDEETQSAYSDYEYRLKPAFNHDIFNYYKTLIHLRKSDLTFVYGDFQFLDISADDKVLAYTRSFKQTTYAILFNNNETANKATLPLISGEIIFSYNADDLVFSSDMIMPPFSGLVIKMGINE